MLDFVFDGVELFVYLVWYDVDFGFGLFDLVLLDFNMLCMDGCEVLCVICEYEWLWYLLVIIFIMFMVELDICVSYQFGVNFYVIKLCWFDELIVVL